MEAHMKNGSIRSSKYTAAAKGQPCQLRFVGVCLDPLGQGHETTVFAHNRHGKGMGIKADDIDGQDSCERCHRFLDEEWPGKISRTVLMEHVHTAMVRTLINRIERGIIFVSQDKPTERKVAQRKPKGQRAAIQGRGFDKTHSRRMDGTTVRREPAE